MRRGRRESWRRRRRFAAGVISVVFVASLPALSGRPVTSAGATTPSWVFELSPGVVTEPIAPPRLTVAAPDATTRIQLSERQLRQLREVERAKQTERHNRPRSSAPVVTELTASGVPTVALKAYLAAERALAKSDPSCRLPWSLLAGIGRVESGHGQYGGAQLRADGNVTEPILGPRLDGSLAGTARIADTDGGRYDGDASFDRAAGPMQFIPSSWAAHAVDADGSGFADPQNMFDAAATAGHYLCASGQDLSTVDGQRAAAYSYNHSDSYVDLVVALARAYASGVSADQLPSPEHPVATGSVQPPVAPSPAAQQDPADSKPRPKPSSKPSVRPSSKPSTKPSADPAPTPDTKPSSTPSSDAKPSTSPESPPSSKPTSDPPSSSPPPSSQPPSSEPPPSSKPPPSSEPAPKPPVAPSAPTGLLLDPSSAGVVVQWSAPQQKGSGIAGYVVTVTRNGTTVVQEKLPANATSLTLRELPAGERYDVSVRAWSERNGSRAKGPAATAVLDTAAPAINEATESTIAWTWDGGELEEIAYVVRILDADGAVLDVRETPETSIEAELPEGAASVQVWTTFAGGTSTPGWSRLEETEPTQPPSEEPSAEPTDEPSASPTPTD